MSQNNQNMSTPINKILENESMRNLSENIEKDIENNKKRSNLRMSENPNMFRNGKGIPMNTRMNFQKHDNVYLQRGESDHEQKLQEPYRYKSSNKSAPPPPPPSMFREKPEFFLPPQNKPQINKTIKKTNTTIIKETVLIVILFIVLASPQFDSIVTRYIPLKNKSPYIMLLLKGLLVGGLYFVTKRFS